jgi:hypothetical protein
MKQDDKTGEVTATPQEVAPYNMLMTEAISELTGGERYLDRQTGQRAHKEAQERNDASFQVGPVTGGQRANNHIDSRAEEGKSVRSAVE